MFDVHGCKEAECSLPFDLLLLQIYAGIEKTGGFETENDDQHTAMAQMVISKCLEKEALCNEFFLQLIKQTTDQPGE